MTEKRFGIYHPVKIGTMSRQCVWIKPVEGGWRVGTRTQFREDMHGSKWQDVIIWKVGPPPEYMLYLEHA